jgi:hypothetical protein
MVVIRKRQKSSRSNPDMRAGSVGSFEPHPSPVSNTIVNLNHQKYEAPTEQPTTAWRRMLAQSLVNQPRKRFTFKTTGSKTAIILKLGWCIGWKPLLAPWPPKLRQRTSKKRGGELYWCKAAASEGRRRRRIVLLGGICKVGGDGVRLSERKKDLESVI